MEKRNLKRFLALVMALSMVMACCALATSVLVPTGATDWTEPVPTFVSLVILASVLAAGAVAFARSGACMAPRSRGDPYRALGYHGASHSNQMTSGQGGHNDGKKRTWRPPKPIGLGRVSSMFSNGNPSYRDVSSPRSAKEQLSSYAFNARDRNRVAMPFTTSVLESCCVKLREMAANFFDPNPLRDVCLRI